jgi:hypothetical protein
LTYWIEEQKQFAVTYVFSSENCPVISLAITKNFRIYARLGALLPPEDKAGSRDISPSIHPADERDSPSLVSRILSPVLHPMAALFRCFSEMTACNIQGWAFAHLSTRLETGQ